MSVLTSRHRRSPRKHERTKTTWLASCLRALVTDRLVAIGVALGVAVLSTGCGAGGSSPAAPTPPAPTASSIAVTSGVDALRTGFFADFTVTATMSDRTTQVVTSQATLATSDPSIATIDASGRLTAFRFGTITINASY